MNFVTINIDRHLQMTVTDSTSTPLRQLSVQLSRAAAAQLADLLDDAAKPGSKSFGSGGGTVIGELIGDVVDIYAKPPTRVVHLGGKR